MLSAYTACLVLVCMESWSVYLLIVYYNSRQTEGHAKTTTHPPMPENLGGTSSFSIEKS